MRLFAGKSGDRAAGGRIWPECCVIGLILLTAAVVRFSFLHECLHYPHLIKIENGHGDPYCFYAFANDIANSWRYMLGLPPVSTDSRWIDHLANPYLQEQNRIYLRPPGYPFFLSVLLALSGTPDMPVRVAQICLGLGTVLLVYIAARMLFGRMAAAAAGLFAATYWILPLYDVMLHAPVLSAFLIMASLVSLLKWQNAVNNNWAFVAGITQSALVITAPACVLFVPVSLAWVGLVAADVNALLRRNYSRVRFRTAAAQMLAFSLGFAAIFSPVLIRNYKAEGRLTMPSSGIGWTLYLGAHPNSNGTHTFETDPRIEADLYREWREWSKSQPGGELTMNEASVFLGKKALDFITDDPRRYLGLVAKRFMMFWGAREVTHVTRDGVIGRVSLLRFLPVGFAGLLAAGIAGLVFLFLPPGKKIALQGESTGRETAMGVLLLCAFLFLWSLPYYFLIVGNLYRVPIIPLMCVLSGFGVTSLLRWVCSGRVPVRLALAVSLLACAWTGGLFSQVSYDSEVLFWVNEGTGPAGTDLSNIQEECGIIGLALSRFPRDDELWLCAADFFQGHGMAEKALETLAHLVRTGNTDAFRVEAAFRYMAHPAVRNQPGEVEAMCRMALQAVPHNPWLWAALGKLLISLPNREEEAVAALENAVNNRTKDADVYLELGKYYRKTRQFECALDRFNSGISVQPDNFWCGWHKARLLMERFEYERALAEACRVLALSYDSKTTCRALAIIEKSHRALGHQEDADMVRSDIMALCGPTGGPDLN